MGKKETNLKMKKNKNVNKQPRKFSNKTIIGICVGIIVGFTILGFGIGILLGAIL